MRHGLSLQDHLVLGVVAGAGGRAVRRARLAEAERIAGTWLRPNTSPQPSD